jgi:diacylglycerol kinase
MKSFAAALRGLFIAIKRERHMKIHLAAAVAVFAAAYIFRVEPWAWSALTLTCALVITAELLNTAIERLCDKLDPDICPYIKDIKDIAAGAVLVCAVAAAIVGIIIFWRVIF